MIAGIANYDADAVAKVIESVRSTGPTTAHDLAVLVDEQPKVVRAIVREELNAGRLGIDAHMRLVVRER